MSVINLFKKNC